jgi:multidrug efflux pump subunit AcrB
LAQPLERQIGIIPGIAEMGSFSATGGTQITVQFELARDIDAAAAAVQAAINAAEPNLPKDLPQPPVYWKANPSGWAVIAISLTSDIVEPKVIYDYADSVIVQKLSQLPGVAKVNVAGAERPAMRIRASPRLLANMNLSLEQVALAATLAAMKAIGYMLDNLSLMALTVGVGFIVDDAVIVIENILRRRDEGEGASSAALNGTRQIGFTILAITAAPRPGSASARPLP